MAGALPLPLVAAERMAQWSDGLLSEMDGRRWCQVPLKWKWHFGVNHNGPSSKNPLSFKWYNAEEEILGKKMKDWMRFSIAFWHTFRGSGADPFGAPTKYWAWEDGTNSLAMAKRRSHVLMMPKRQLLISPILCKGFHVVVASRSALSLD